LRVLRKLAHPSFPRCGKLPDFAQQPPPQARENGWHMACSGKRKIKLVTVADGKL
jgi:hypothetical protein